MVLYLRKADLMIYLNGYLYIAHSYILQYVSLVESQMSTKILFGFVLSAYLNMSVLAIAMLAVVACAFIFQSKEAQRSNPVAQGATMTAADMEDE